MQIRTPYNYDTNQASIDSGLKCEDPTRTQQQFKDDADINDILRRFRVTGQLPTSVRMPQFADFIDAVDDYQTAMNSMRAAEESFAQMPSRIRERFQNNPQKFLEFCEDDRNRDEAAKLGLVKAPMPVQNPQPAATTPAAAPPETKPAKAP